MTKKRSPINLTKLADESTRELRAMTAELFGAKFELEGAVAKPSHWSHRFAASGKQRCVPAPRIRLS